MATEIIMPKAGMAMETGTIIQWMKQPGDQVEVGDILLEIETDKVSMEVEAEVSGYFLGSINGPGDVVPVIQTIGYIGEKGEAMPAGGAAPAAAPEAPAAEAPAEASAPAPSEAAPVAAPVGGKTMATPAARRVAKEHGVDIAAVAAATGRQPVYAADVPAATSGAGVRSSSLAKQELAKAGVSAQGIDGTGSSGRILRSDVAEQAPGLMGIMQGIGSFVPPVDVPVEIAEGDTTTPLSGVRKVTAQRMMTSQLTIPPTTLHTEVKADKMLALRKTLKDEGLKVSVNTLILKAVAAALAKCEWMRVSLSGNTIVNRKAVNLGMAVASDKGLLVPVIKDADKLSLGALSNKAGELAEKARNGKLSMDDMTGGVFSVSNLGMFGITTFTPVVNPPEAAILGVGTIRNVLARNEAGEIVDESLIDLSITLDHRLIDGAQGAIFLSEVKQLMESPLRLLAGM